MTAKNYPQGYCQGAIAISIIKQDTNSIPDLPATSMRDFSNSRSLITLCSSQLLSAKLQVQTENSRNSIGENYG
jgi:hypothetical protein